jgi:uncharacterized protein YjdB
VKLTYPHGSAADAFGVIRASREAGIPGILIEHAFIDNAKDAAFLSSDANLVKLGQADAKGIASYYGLVKDKTAQGISLVKYRAHIAYLGWQDYVYDHKIAGTTGKKTGVQAINISLQNQPKPGGIQYRVYYQSTGWQAYATNGAQAGTTGQNKVFHALQIKLTGDMASSYDIYYRAHVANYGWLDWAKNGASAGDLKSGNQLEAYEVVVLPKGSAAPGSTTRPSIAGPESYELSYSAHVANLGWRPAVNSGATAGTTGKSLRLEALTINMQDAALNSSLEYRAHVQNVGWQAWCAGGKTMGTTNRSLAMEAVQIRLKGELAANYDVYYRAHSANIGWLGWAKNGEMAGTSSYNYRMEAIQVKLVKKNSTSKPQQNEASYKDKPLSYQAHVAKTGWAPSVQNGSTAGTTGKSLAIEALKINLVSPQYSGSVEYSAHVQNVGWQGWKSNGSQAGTTGKSLNMEAIQIQLTGEMAKHYDIYYRVHSAQVGWLDWTKNGALAGTTGFNYRMEAIQIQLVAKGSKAPAEKGTPYMSKFQNQSAIMGPTQTTAAQMARYYKSMGKAYPSSVYAARGAGTIEQFCELVYAEARSEGVRAEVLFVQAMKETGWLQFGGNVKAEQCNFGGIGSTGAGVAGASFLDVRTGLRAQTQHLKAYACTNPLVNSVVDPRFQYVTRGIAPNLEDLNGRWAVPGTNYGQDLRAMIQNLYTFAR